MTRLFCILLTLLLSLSGPAIGEYSDFGRWGIAANIRLEGVAFAQKTFSQTFSSGGKFAGQTIDDVAEALGSGAMKAGDVPIEYIVRDGITLMLNTRSAQALQQAGIPRAQWNSVNMTGNIDAELRLTRQLQGNGLGSGGIANPRPSGR